MNQTMELILTDGQTLKLEVFEGQPTHRLNLWLVDSEENQLLSSTHLLAVPHLAKEEPNNNEFLKERLDEEIYELYQTVLHHPTLANVSCSLVAELDNTNDPQRFMTLKEGSITDCLKAAFDSMEEHYLLHIWLPIGETVYNFVSFDATAPDRQLKQVSYLPKRVIQEAILTFCEIDEHEIRLIETDEFVADEVINSLRALSEKTYYERIQRKGKYSLFEEIASDINCYGGAKYAVEEIFDDVKDWNNPRNQTRLKGLVHLAIHEG